MSCFSPTERHRCDRQNLFEEYFDFKPLPVVLPFLARDQAPSLRGLKIHFRINETSLDIRADDALMTIAFYLLG